MLWINVYIAAGGLWKNCRISKNERPEKALKTRLFFDMIGKLANGVIHRRAWVTHILWKLMWISTTYPQETV